MNDLTNINWPCDQFFAMEKLETTTTGGSASSFCGVTEAAQHVINSKKDKPHLDSSSSLMALLRRSTAQAALASNKKRVRFAQSQDGQVHCVEHVYEKDIHNPQDLWWSNEEMKLIRWECNNIVNYFRHNENYVRLLRQLYRVANDPQEFDDKIAAGSHLVLVAAERARGLERLIIARTVTHVKEYHMDATLNAIYYGDNSDHEMDSAAHDLCIRDVSVSCSSICGTFASAFGILDVQAAALVYSTTVW
uniref:Uncharacterized protein n=1 Tax=Entomoneis paludosa TaxID=265537 RepID=A0A6U3EUI5_9STRA|mmetsp:Transcript_891/g.2082  ORF Transcript_891/g.2082 Transcript_891/m.2082 type:complete len:249 (+) Transcript_891:58-804(+)|eukprot:CAMPEP_0172450616 /NCGR_PEP_ID=MMETSP1065-20121228/8886_1 /TAXON_ID=265537 /ORGANISM="Amphiprora paludosa, Strain CCMP125" /LENGTH=248 /DNA_ID=CAMNT_0013202413 /DNA_START=32 /DNA_END=775 /DNA_ORIENTATION=-